MGITAGSDGNLWFTEASGNRIGQITPQGSITETSAGISAKSNPAGLTAGPDGNLWFTEVGGNRIGEVLLPTGIATQPRSALLDAGQSVTLTAAANDATAGVQWQVSAAAGQPFIPLSDDGVYGGTSTTSLTITGATTALDATEYRAVFSHSGAASPYVTTAAATLTVNPALSLTLPKLSNRAQLPPDDVGFSYKQTITVSGGTTPYTTLAVANFDAGTTGLTAAAISASAAQGALTIAGVASAAGTVTFTVNVIDKAGANLTATFTITVRPAISVTPSLPSGGVGTSYNQVITFTGGTNLQQPTFTFDPGTTGMTAGAVALGNNPFSITIQGTATHIGTASLKVLAKDHFGTLTHTFNIIFTVPMPTLTGPSSPVTTTATPAFTWTDTAALWTYVQIPPAVYDLWVNDTTAKISQVIRQPHLTTPSFTPTAPLTSGHTYTAWVQELTALGESSGWSQAFVFTVTLPAAPAVPAWRGPLEMTSPAIAWTDTGAARYDLWVDDVTAKIPQVIRQQNLTASSFTPASPLIMGHQYVAWVEAFDSFGQTAGWSKPLISQLTPVAPSLSGPSSPAPRTPIFTWTDRGADHYDLWVDDTTANVSQVIRQQNVSGTSFSATTPLLGGHQYTAWVSALNSLGQSSVWSEPLTFVVANPPAAPVLAGPAGNTTTVTPTITWNPPTSGTAAGYDLWVDDATTGAGQVIRQKNLPAGQTTFPTAPLTVGHQYQAWVRAFDALGQFSPWSALETFTIGTPPGTPSWTGPAPNSMISSTPTLAWTSPAAAASYELWVSDNTTPTFAFMDQTSLSAPSFSAFTPALTEGHQYTAWVRALNNLNQKGPWSAPLTFSMVLAVPTLTGPASPAPTGPGPASLVSTTPTITWTESTGAVRYDLWVNDVTSNTAQVIRQKNLTGTSFTTGELQHGHTYWVWVQAFDAFGQGSGWQVVHDSPFDTRPTPLIFTVG